MAKDVLIQFRVTSDIARSLDEFSITSGTTRSQALRLILQEALHAGWRGSFVTLCVPQLPIIQQRAQEEGISALSWIRRALKRALEDG